MIEILCSGVSLGHYIPGLLLRDRLRALGVMARVRVFEQLLDDQRRERIEQTRRSYHASFRVATTAQRLAAALTPPAEPALADVLLDEWSARKPYLVVMSGYWISIVRRWLAQDPSRRELVEIFHVDVTESPGWRAQALTEHEVTRTWWCDGRGPTSTLHSMLPLDAPEVARESRVVVHGGGWGIGDYRDAIASLLDAGLGVDLVAYEEPELDMLRSGVRGLLMSPTWKPWLDDEPDYPPLTVVGEPAIDFVDRGHRLLHFIARALAIISKPGGATLVESLGAATPIAFATPFGAHEAINADVWCRLGGGIPLGDWRARGFDRDAVQRCRDALVEMRARTPMYPDALARRFAVS
jgi:hypothetical protein